jgi:hypothetical protein
MPDVLDWLSPAAWLTHGRSSLALALRACAPTDAHASDWYVYITGPHSTRPAGATTQRDRVWYGTGFDAFATLARLDLYNPTGNETIPAGTVVELYWSDEVTPCAECSNDGRSATRDYGQWLIEPIPGENAYRLTALIDFHQGVSTLLGQFWWLGIHPRGPATEYDIDMQDLPAIGVRSHYGVAYTSLGAACEADLDGDGLVGGPDYLAFAQQFGRVCEP